MMKLGRVSSETKGVEIPLKVEDKDTCVAGSMYWIQTTTCPV